MYIHMQASTDKFKTEVNIEEALSCLFLEGEKSAWQVY